jgi:hypothetical protein
MKRTQAQIEAWKKTMNMRPIIPWNKGKSYIHQSKGVYANRGAWNMAMRRVYPDKCMICGWEEASCDTHHLVSKSQGGKYSIDNGVVLCPNCHRLADNGKISLERLKDAKSKANAH